MSGKENTGKKQVEKPAWKPRGKTGKQAYAPKAKKQPGEIPMLQWGKGSSFHVFQEAIAKVAMEKYGFAGTMFETGIKYEPLLPVQADYTIAGVDPAACALMYNEALKGYTKQKQEIIVSAPKIYGFIEQYLSAESMDEIKQHANYAVFSKAHDPVALWQAIIETHWVDSVSKVPGVLKAAARTQYKNCKQGGYESLVTYRERFDAACKAYTEHKNAALAPEDMAMDFFDGLDSARYMQFKVDINNNMTMNPTFTLPTINKVYELASNWVKASVINKQGVGATYATTHLDKPAPRKPKTKPTPTESQKSEEEEKKPSGKKDLKNIECYKCKEKGHYANKCPTKKKGNEEEEIDANDEIHTLNATWEASNFCTHQVHSAVDNTLKVQPNEVLLDNAADISIIKPHLLENLEESDREIKINGVGGLTLTVNQMGYLPNFFKVYSSEKTLANVLSFSDVEDLYPITYIPGESFIVHLPDRDVEFKRRGKLYVALWEEVSGALTTVQEAESFYSKAEVQ